MEAEASCLCAAVLRAPVVQRSYSNQKHSITHSSRSQYAIYGGLVKAVFHPASYTCTSRSLTVGVLAKLKVYTLHIQITQSRDCARVITLRNLEIGMQSQDSENAQRNFKIAQILRLRGTYRCMHSKCRADSVCLEAMRA